MRRAYLAAGVPQSGLETPIDALTAAAANPTMAAITAIVAFTHLLAGFDHPILVRLVHPARSPLHQRAWRPMTFAASKATASSCALPSHHRYQLTPLGRRVAVLFTKTYGRVLAPGLAVLLPALPLRSFLVVSRFPRH